MNLPPDQEARLRRWLEKTEEDLGAEAERIVQNALSPEVVEQLGQTLSAAMGPALEGALEDFEERLTRLEKLFVRIARDIVEGIKR